MSSEKSPAAGPAAEPQKWGNTMSEQNDKVTCPYCGASVRVTGTSRAVLCPVCRKSFAKPTMQKKATDLFRDGETDDEFRDTMKKVTKEAGFEEYADNAGAALDDERKETLRAQLKENREELHKGKAAGQAAGGTNRMAVVIGIIIVAIVLILLIVLR